MEDFHEDSTVHPRVCGEQVPKPSRRVDFHGSSPRVRGTVRLTHAELTNRRFIPACAGNSSA